MVKGDSVTVFHKTLYPADMSGEKVQLHVCLNSAQEGRC